MNPLGPGDPLRLGPYRLVGVLGTGGMGKVYFGQDSQGRPAAVKVLLPHFAYDQGLVQRFLREADAARAVTGRGVARVLSAQTEGGRPWIATEFLAGPTLEQAVTTHGPLPEEAVQSLAVSLAEALQSIHGTGLVHRDLKPANIVLTSKGPRVIDFGIARPEHGLTLTTTGEAPVTPGYGAPEQVLGHRVGPTADVFALGAVLAFASCGHRAYNGPHVAAVQYAVVHGEADLSHVPDRLRPLIGPCLSKEPAFRPTPDQIRTAFAAPRPSKRIWRQGALGSDIEQREIEAKRWSPSGTTVVSPLPNRRRFLVGIATGAAVLVAGGTAAWLLRDKGEADRQSSPSQAKNKNNFTSPAGTRIWGPLPLADPWTPPALGVEDVVVFADKAGGLVAHGAMDGKRRWAALNVVPSAEYRPLPGGLIVAADAAGTVYAYKATTGEEEWSAQADATMLLAVNDSAVFVMSRDKKVRAIDAKTQKTLWAVGLGFESGGAAAAEDRLVLHGDDGTVLALDARSGNKVWERESATSLGKLPAINGDTVLISGKSLSLINLKDGKELWSVPSEGASEYDQWNSGAIDGDFVYALDGTMLHCRSLGDGAKVWTYEMHTTPAFYPPQVSGSFICGSSGADPKSFDVVAIHKGTGKKAWGYSQSSLKSPKLAANGDELLLIQNDLVTALSAGPA